MLCDEILADQYLPMVYPGFAKVQAGLRAAHKFVLSPDFAAAADGLVDNYKELARILPFCRLPSPLAWMEWAQADRPNFVKAAVDFPEFQSAPRRVGVLLTSLPERPWNWVTTLMWSLRASSTLPAANNVSSILVQFNTKDKLEAKAYQDGLLGQHVQIYTARFCPPEVAEMLDAGGNEMTAIMSSDWGGEIRFLIAALGLFNARNVMQTETVDNTQFNKKRAKAGKLPLASHTLLKIRAVHRRSLVGRRGQGTPADIRKHFVVGHWKTRRTGLFWWNPYWRGHGPGVVTHDYEID